MARSAPSISMVLPEWRMIRSTGAASLWCVRVNLALASPRATYHGCIDRSGGELLKRGQGFCVAVFANCHDQLVLGLVYAHGAQSLSTFGAYPTLDSLSLQSHRDSGRVPRWSSSETGTVP